jgi:hypothetical protein
MILPSSESDSIFGPDSIGQAHEVKYRCVSYSGVDDLSISEFADVKTRMDVSLLLWLGNGWLLIV